jgi:prepilin-type N-terminal cleavage/methylation domain-containing protein
MEYLKFNILKINSNKGFTLVEIVMTIVLLGIISGIVFITIYQGGKSYGDIYSMNNLSSQDRIAMERLSREIRRVRCTVSGNSCTATASDITEMSTSSEFRFVNTIYEGRGFRYDSGSNAIYLRQGSGAGDPEDVLIGNVSAFSFDYLDSDDTTTATVSEVWSIVVNITLSTGGKSVDFKTRIHPRSYN